MSNQNMQLPPATATSITFNEWQAIIAFYYTGTLSSLQTTLCFRDALNGHDLPDCVKRAVRAWRAQAKESSWYTDELLSKRSKNIDQIINAVKSGHSMIQMIAKVTEIHKTTVAKFLRDLCDQNIVCVRRTSIGHLYSIVEKEQVAA